MTRITIWPWKDAPATYRNLSLHGGDEDIVAKCEGSRRGLPYSLQALFDIDDTEAGDYLEGWGHIQRIALRDDTVVAICAHA